MSIQASNRNVKPEGTKDFLGVVIKKAKNVSIHIIAYQKNNKKLAKQRAKSIKKYLLNKESGPGGPGFSRLNEYFIVFVNRRT